MKTIILIMGLIVSSTALGLVTTTDSSSWDRRSAVYLLASGINGEQYCSGFWVDSKTIMTAAHCLEGHSRADVINPDTKRLRLYKEMGLWTTDLFLHPSYQPNIPFWDSRFKSNQQFDIGFVKFNQRMTDYSSRLSFNKLSVGDEILIHAYGHDTCAPGKISGMGKLRYGYNTIHRIESHFNIIKGRNQPHHNTSVSTCAGDDGAALRYHSTNPSSQYRWGSYGLVVHRQSTTPSGEVLSYFVGFHNPSVQNFISSKVEFRGYSPWDIRP